MSETFPHKTAKSEFRTESRQPSNLNLRHNDNSFHVLASILVEFFQERISQDDDSKTLTLKPDDGEVLQRLLPRSALRDFIDAVNYRLEVTPVIAVSPIHFLTLQCQELCLDKNEQDKNPILIACSLENASITLDIRAVLSDAYKSSVSNCYSNVDEDITLGDKANETSYGFVGANVSEAENASDISSDGSAIKISSSQDIAKEMLAEAHAMSAVDDSRPLVPEKLTEIGTGIETSTAPFLGSELVEGPMAKTANSHDDQGNVSDVSSDGSVIKISSSQDIAEEMLAEAHAMGTDEDTRQIQSKATGSAEESPLVIGKLTEIGTGIEKSTAPFPGSVEVEGPIAKTLDSGDEFLVLESVKTNSVIVPNKDCVSVLENQVVSVVASSGVPSPFFEKVDFDHDEATEEGEEIEVLPTLTFSYDEATDDDFKLSHKGHRNTQCEDAPTSSGDKKDGVKCIQLENISTEGHHDVLETIEIRDCLKVNIEIGSEYCSNIVEHSCLEDKENNASIQSVGDSKVQDLFVTEKSPVKTTVSPVIDSANKTVLSINSVSRSIQEAAGNFFEDIRWAIDEKIIAFEDAVVDAIVAKPIKRERHDFQSDSTIDKGDANESTSVSKQQAFESIVREQIPDVEPQKRMRSQREQSGLSFFEGIATGLSPSASEKTSRNGLAFPSDEGSTIGSHLSILDLSQYDSLNVVDTATKQQLLLETKEALTLMKQSITPETTRFWRDHIQSLQSRLESLRVEPQQSDKRIDLTSQPTDSRNIDCIEKQPISAFELADRGSPADMSEVRSIFGIPVVPGFFQFSDASTAQDDSLIKGASLETPSLHKIPRDNTIDWNQNPRSNSEIELCPSTIQKTENTLAEMDYSEPGHITLPGIDPIDSDYEYPLVDVVAPADLPGGYHFEAEIEGQRFLATVPPGGVQQGETFTCYMRELDSVAIDIPVGDWKDGFCNLFELGWCHPVLWNALFCPLIALSQIQTRVNLDFLGRPKFNDLPYSNRFIMLTVVGFWLFTNVGLFAACNVKWSHGLELSVADVCAFFLVNVAMFGFVVFVTQSTRSSVREKFMIRERQCYDLEDVCCATLCLPCTVGQMSRHTANYDDYEAVCCSKTGLPNGVRVNQEPAKVKEITTENEDGFMV